MIHEVPRSPRVRRARARRLEAIEEAALDLILSDGLEALTMARLGAEVDLTPGALYRYFASKDALIVALQARALARIEELLARGGAALAWPADSAVRALAELWWTARFYRNLAHDEPRVFALLSITLGDPRHLVGDAHARLIAGAATSLLEGLARKLDDAVEAGALEPGDGRARAVVFWAAVHGVSSVAKLDRVAPGLFAPPARVDELARALLRGWGASREALQAAEAHLAREVPAMEPLAGNAPAEDTVAEDNPAGDNSAGANLAGETA